MMVERHYDEETLLMLLEKQPIGADHHLSSCADCSEKLDSFGTITSILREHDVWDGAQVPRELVAGTVANLRAFADRMAFEDAAAEAILPELLAGPREEWMPRLMQHPEWRTAGVVRKLIAATERVFTTMPPDALEMTALSTEIAEHLDPATVRSDTLARLRGSAWRDRAWVLFYVGRFVDGLRATERADLAFQDCVVDRYDRARVGIIRTLCLRAMEEVSTAVAAAKSSSDTFIEFGDLNRLARARVAETHLLFTRSEYGAALSILQSLEQQLSAVEDADMQALVLPNLAYCLWKLGRLDEALRMYDASAVLHADLGEHTEAVRIQWGVASILVTAGRIDDAMERFKTIKKSFDDLGMTSESALVSLDIAELMIARSDYESVEELCRAAMISFQKAGIAYTARALTALAYIRETARHRAVTPTHVKHVREYLRRLPQDGELLFVPLPCDPQLSNSR
jgi:tetratricopeptide (TPR) repeat protein